MTATQLSPVEEREKTERLDRKSLRPQGSAEEGLASQLEVLEQKSPVRGPPHRAALECAALRPGLGAQPLGNKEIDESTSGRLSIKLSAAGDLSGTSLWLPKELM